MASNWKKIELGEIASIIGGGTPSSKIDDYWEGDIPWITPKDLSNHPYKLISRGSRNITQLGLEKSSARLMPAGTLLISSRAPIGYTAIAKNELCTSQGFKSLILKDGYSSDFFYYLIKGNISKLEAVSSGSTFKEISGSTLKKISFIVPPLPEQKAIAHILGSLDDKIELNRQMNETLEAMAQALFKSWFVDFDPVIDNALAAGNAIPDEFIERAEQRKGIEKEDNSEIQSLFPDEFEFTEEMGWIPKGWNIQSFGDLLDSTIGGDWGKPEQDDKHTRESVIIRGTDIPKLKLGERSEAPKRWVEEKKLKTRILKPFDIVVEISGGSPTQSTGRSIIITEQILERLGGVAEPASFCRKFSPLNKFLGLYAGIHLQKIYDDGKMWEYQNQSTGISNFQTTSFLEREELVVPSESVLLKFYETLEPIISKMSSNQQIELARLRDTLLPKLMSGELRIVDAAEMVEDA